MTKRYLTQESARVLEKIVAGGDLRVRLVRRRSPPLAVRFAFADGDVVKAQTIEGLITHGKIAMRADGAFKIRDEA